MKLLLLLSLLLTASAAGEKPCCRETARQPAALPARSLHQSEARFTDDQGQSCTLSRFRGRPVVIAFMFTECSRACPQIVTDLLALQARLSPASRRETCFVLVSFDCRRDRPGRLAAYRASRRLDGAWTLLHGEEDDVRELAALLQVRYEAEPGGGFAHSNGFSLLDRQGLVAHQRVGLEGGLDSALAALERLAQSPSLAP